MINRTDKLVFLVGLSIFSIGQFWIYQFGSTTKELSSVDVSHWIMLIGVVLYLPYIMRLPRHGVGLIASILMTIGVVCMIGMCIIDLVFWGIADDGLRAAVAKELINTPIIWQPFMLWGNEEVLMTGFILACSLYIKHSKVGPLLVVFGSTLAIAGASWFNFIAYILISIGFLICFDFLRRDNQQESQC